MSPKLWTPPEGACLIDTSGSMCGTTKVQAQSVWWNDEVFVTIDPQGDIWWYDSKSANAWLRCPARVAANGDFVVARIRKTQPKLWDHIFSGGDDRGPYTLPLYSGKFVWESLALQHHLYLLDDRVETCDPAVKRMVSDCGRKIRFWRAADKPFTQATECYPTGDSFASPEVLAKHDKAQAEANCLAVQESLTKAARKVTILENRLLSANETIRTLLNTMSQEQLSEVAFLKSQESLLVTADDLQKGM